MAFRYVLKFIGIVAKYDSISTKHFCIHFFATIVLLASEATTHVGQIKGECDRLKQENEMLKFKLDVLLDMVNEVSSEVKREIVKSNERL